MLLCVVPETQGCWVLRTGTPVSRGGRRVVELVGSFNSCARGGRHSIPDIFASAFGGCGEVQVAGTPNTAGVSVGTRVTGKIISAQCVAWMEDAALEVQVAVRRRP